MYSNKGTYGHPGGILHAFVHAVGTMLALCMFCPHWIALGLLDGVIHYHIDYNKMKFNAKWNLKPDNSEYFWWLLGADQLAHYITYCGLVWLVVG